MAVKAGLFQEGKDEAASLVKATEDLLIADQ